VRPYWTLAARPAPSSFEQALEEFAALFDDAVRIRLMSDVPLGAFLSGGLDSGLVVAAMAKAMDRPVRTFSIGFETEGWHSELPFAAQVAARFGTDHQTRIVTGLDMRTLLATTAAQMDEPLADVAAVPTYLLSAFARDHVTVALTGEGADELFAGYDHYAVEWTMERIAWMPLGLRRALGTLGRPFVGLRMRKALAAMGMDQAARFVFMRSVLPESLRRGLLRADVAAQVPALHLEEQMGRHFPTRENGLNAVLRADTLEWLPDDLLMKVDKMSMLASLEARVPFLDYRVVELVSGFAPEWKYRRDRSKVLLKAVAERTLPAEIVHRPKHGFMPPVGSWIRGTLRPFVEEHLLDPGALSVQWLEPQATRRLLERHMNGEERLALPIWVILCLEVWLRTGRASGAAPS
jgi:asparagine synthase (glutamine-hydrolysing)